MKKFHRKKLIRNFNKEKILKLYTLHYMLSRQKTVFYLKLKKNN